MSSPQSASSPPSPPSPPSAPVARTNSVVGWAAGFFARRATLRADLRDVGIAAGLIALILYTTGRPFLPAAVSFVLSPGVSGDQVTKLGHLFLATFPLAVGVMLIVTALMKGAFNGKNGIERAAAIGVILLVSSVASALLGLGSISGDEIKAIFLGRDVLHCSPNPFGSVPLCLPTH